MRNLTAGIAAVISMLAAVPAVAAPDTPQRIVMSCPLASRNRVILKAESHGVDGDELFVEADGKTTRAFLDMPESDFVGRIVLAKCIDNTLIFVLEYGSPYLKGVAIRDNPKSHLEERIYFAEKALPRWLYLGDAEMMVVIPNAGHESNKKNLVYKYISGKGQPEESSAMNGLPVSQRKLIPVVGK